MNKKCLSTNNHLFELRDSIILEHITTGERVVLLETLGDGYGSGSNVLISRLNTVTGSYEEIKMHRKSLTVVDQSSEK